MSVDSKFHDAPEPTESCVRETGRFLHLPDAIEQYPNAGLLLYNRVSSYAQSGKGKLKLEEKTYPVADEVRKLAPGKLRQISRGVEEGKLSKPRRKLIKAAKNAKQRGWILVASDLSRFIRSESYDARTNLEAWPTLEEFAKFHEMTFDVVCATLLDPAGRVGGQRLAGFRGVSRQALPAVAGFQPPPSEPDLHLSTHPALQ